MSTKTRKNEFCRLRQSAPLFAALSDEVRLALLTKLSDGILLSITQLSGGSTITRQAITKHLRVLQNTGLVRSIRRGREKLFQIEPKPLKEVGDSLNAISRQWDEALSRLKPFVEN